VAIATDVWPTSKNSVYAFVIFGSTKRGCDNSWNHSILERIAPDGDATHGGAATGKLIFNAVRTRGATKS
jgi:hypothetical protein